MQAFITAKVEECSTAHEVVMSVDVLIAVRWVVQAWESVSSETIKKCFRKAGILDKDFGVVSQDVLEDDPFADLELDHGTDEQLSHKSGLWMACALLSRRLMIISVPRLHQ